MFDISNNGIITMTKGDSIKIKLIIRYANNDKTILYDLKEDDKVFFYLQESDRPELEYSLIIKELTNKDVVKNNVEINLDSEDTINIPEGYYKYQIKLFTGSGEVNTLVTRKPFHLID